jgi:rubrerythrin
MRIVATPIRADVHERFRRVVARAIERADAEMAAELAKVTPARRLGPGRGVPCRGREAPAVTFAWLLPMLWRCSRCCTTILTRQLGARCPRCGHHEDE